MTLTQEGDYITVSIEGHSETMHKGEWSKLISRPSKIERFTFARGTPDHFSTDEMPVEPPCA